MPWFRTTSGRLIHGEGGLAAVYADYGWQEVEGDVDLEALQVQADVEAEEADRVDEAHRRREQAAQAKQQPSLPSPQGPPGELVVSYDTPPLTDEDRAAIEKAKAEETPR